MIVTRTERFTDWLFQGVHMNEVAATVGNGLLAGHIYFRYAHDFIKEGEKVLRSRSFITLSDGSVYELGAGAVSSKVTVIDHGVTSSGDVHLEVRGIDGSGIGVQSITRDVTIQYDDGKVPVLDEDQLKIIMSGLHDSLEESMVETAETVKAELREELNTIAIDVKQECAQATNAAKAELTSKINSEIATVSGKVDTEVATLNTSIASVDSKVEALRTYGESRIIVGQATVGQYTIPKGSHVNILYARFDNDTWHNPLMLHNESTGTLKLLTGISPRNRIATFFWTGALVISDGYNNFIEMQVRNKNGDTLAMSHFYLFRDAGSPSVLNRFQMSVDLFIKANDSAAILEDGVRIEFTRGGSNNVVLRSGGEFMYRIVE